MLTDNWIANRWVPARSGATDDIIDPATGNVIGAVASSDAADVDAAVAAAQAAFGDWSARTPRERSEVLHRVADVIADNIEELSALESRNVG
ncbi:MAG: aldehyde dehydrogenase family protein, partial [Ilumatobacteraceae bacterium]